MDCHVASLADHQCLPFHGRHFPLPLFLWLSPWSVNVCQLPNMVYLYGRTHPSAQLASPGQESLHNLGSFGGRSVPCRIEPEVNHSHAFWNPLEREAPERGYQRSLVRPLNHDLKRLAIKDLHAVLLED